MTMTTVEHVTEEMLVKYPNLGKNHSKEAIIKVLSYVGGSSPPSFDDDYFADVEAMSSVLAETKVKITYLTTDYYFPEDREVRDIYRITVTRKGKRASMKFGASLQMTWNHEEPDLYDILTSIASDCSLGQYIDFEEFCDNVGMDADSRTAEKMYKAARKQYKKLSELFDESEIMSFPA